MLRGLFGLTAEAPPGASVTVALTLLAAGRKWDLMSNLEIAAHPSAPGASAPPDANRPAVIELGLPAEACGQDCTLILQVSTKSDRQVRLAVPYLSVCAR
jgi:hypothetical protein